MTRFSDLSLDPKVLKAVSEAGYETPTPIQAQAIPHALEGRDVLGIAQTGTGKTASFTLPMITRLGRGRARARMPRSLVLAPTRELAAQVAENFDIYARYTKLTKALLIGGVAFGEQNKLIDRGVDVLIATPGRLLDHFERGKLLLTGVEVMVVDEADRMLDMGFIPDIERIFKLTPFTRQTFFYSATMPPEIERLTKTFLQNPARVEVARQATASETIEQVLITVTPPRRDRAASEKRKCLRALIESEGDKLTNAIVFCNRKVEVDVLTKSLRKHKIDAAAIHGDLDQSVRTRTLEGFRNGELRILVASDVAARGLDVPSVSHVFNFDVPTHPEDYVHRIGRTGRAGRAGKALTIATPADDKLIAAVEGLIRKPLPRADSPLGAPTLPTQATEDADTASGDAPARTRRSRTRRTTRAEAPAPATSDVPATAAPQSAPETPVAETDATAAPAAATSRSAAPRQDPGARRRERGKDKERGHERADDRREPRRGAVVGMGDHVPDFLMREFRAN
ncbi:MAG: DEAD/DEAH box helicase [Rhodobacteraceae bacterium]|nr:DEAD/DEAH box helicase [Paracoccaceae bacterium]